MKSLTGALFASMIIAFTGCNNEEIGNYRDVNPETVFFDYVVSGEEELDDINIRLQYRFAGGSGTTLVLEEPSSVSFDGQKLAVDSSGFNGAYYEVSRPRSEFAGSHTIVFTDPKGKKYTEKFDFVPFTLKTPLAGKISRDSLVLEFDGLDEPARLTVMMTDTASYSQGVELFDTVRNGRLVIGNYDLQKLQSGPIHLEIFRETVRKPAETTQEGGRLRMVYNIKRQFTLE